MRYLLQVYFNGAQERLAQLPEPDRRAIVDEYIAFFSSPEIVDGNQLQPPATAIIVRVDGGETIQDPRAFGGGEPLGGYYLVEAADLETAVSLAARIPAARMGGVVEVRPVVAFEPATARR